MVTRGFFWMVHCDRRWLSYSGCSPHAFGRSGCGGTTHAGVAVIRRAPSPLPDAFPPPCSPSPDRDRCSSAASAGTNDHSLTGDSTMQPSSQQPTTDQRPQTNSPDHTVHTGNESHADSKQDEQWRLYVQQQKRLHCPTCGESGGVIY